MRTILTLIIIMLASALMTQTETFDLTTYTPPTGWKKEVKNNFISYTKTDNVKRTWCQIGIYRSTESKGSIEADFDSEWQILASDPYQIKEAPKSGGIQEAEGWKIKVGSGTFSFNNSDAQAILSVISGNGRIVSIMAINNSQDYMPQIQDLLGSIELGVPGANTNISTNTNTYTQDQSPAATFFNGYSFSTSNFDNGWNSTVTNDYVQVSKGNITAFMYYTFPLADNLRSDDEYLRDYYWSQIIAPRYTIINTQKRLISTMDYPRIYFMEAEAVDNRSRRSVHIAFRIYVEKSMVACVEVVAPTKSDYDASFPDVDRITELFDYNKFAVSQNDIAGGVWKRSDTNFMEYYNIYTGNNAGVNSAATFDKFQFYAGGTYQSEHKGTNGMIGSQQFFQETLKGNFSASNW